LEPILKPIVDDGLRLLGTVGSATALGFAGILALAAVVAGLAAALAGAGILTGAGMFVDRCLGGLATGAFRSLATARSTDAAHSADSASRLGIHSGNGAAQQTGEGRGYY
jgi:hypothetical protein